MWKCYYIGTSNFSVKVLFAKVRFQLKCRLRVCLGNGDTGPVHSGRRCPARPDGDIRPEAILSTSFGSLRTAIHRQVTCTCQIWIPGWILPHFDVRTISVASKLKKLQIFLYYWQKIFDGTKLDSDGERSSGCECYSWRLIIPAHTLQHCTVGEYFD